MATAEEVLQTMAETYAETDKVLTIDNELRTITIPPGITNIGVESDDGVHRLHFRMPRQYGEFDLSEFDIRINYLNANNEGDKYAVLDKSAEEDYIDFSWLVGRHALAYRGNVTFIVCLRKSDVDTVEKEFNTTVATLPVLEGLETTEQVIQEYPDALEEILRRLDDLEENGGGGSGNPGKDGVGIKEIKKTNTSGLVDTYTITLTDNRSYTFTVTNGEKGDPGATPNIQIGTVQTLEPGQQATASMSGTPENPVLNLGIPKGYDGTEEILERTAFLTDAGREEKQSMISFIDDDCRVETYNLLFKQVIEPLTVPYTVSCPPEALNDLEGQYMTTSQLLEMYSAGVSVSSHHLKQYNMDQFDSSEEYNSDLVSCTQEFKNMGIKDVVSVAYPQGIVVNDYVNTVKKHYQMGFTINRGINQIPYESYFMKRCEVFPTNGMYTLDDAKGLVDQVASEGGWLIFMTHAWYETFNVESLKELIAYIQEKKVDIIDINNAIKTTGNIIDIGKFQKPLTDVSTPFFVVDKTGAIWTNTINLVKRSEVTVDIINVGYHVGYYLTINGNTLQHSDTLRTISDPVTASAGEVYRLTCSAVYTNALYVIYDSNGEVLEAKQPDSNVAEAINGDTVLTDYEVTMPEGTASFRVSSNRNIQPEGYVIKKIEPVQDDNTGEGGILGGSADIPRQEMQNTDTTVTLDPNKLYVFPEMTSLTVTLATPSDPNVANEYHFFFTSGATATTLTLNDVLSDAYSIEANMKYEVSILEGVAYIKGVATGAA